MEHDTVIVKAQGRRAFKKTEPGYLAKGVLDTVVRLCISSSSSN